MVSRYHDGATASKDLRDLPPGGPALPPASGRRYSCGMVSTDGDRGLRSRPEEPHVFECGSCGKVFEARTNRAFCPECDSGEVTRLTD
jgi:hypothetical protein